MRAKRKTSVFPVVGTPDAYADIVLPVEFKTAKKAPRPADVVLPVGANARPEGKGWMLVDYSWNEDTGVARYVYRRRWNAKERQTIDVPQPAGHYHNGWNRSPVHDAAVNDPEVLARYFEAQHVNMAMSAIGAYGR